MQELSEAFKLRDLGLTSFLLGMEITRDRPNRRIMLSQRQYVIDMLERCGFSDYASVKTLMDPGKRLSAVKDTPSPKHKAFM